MTIKEAIKKAIEAGWQTPESPASLIIADHLNIAPYKAHPLEIASRYPQLAFLDSSFWQSLGKALGDEETYKTDGLWGAWVSGCCGSKIVQEYNHDKCTQCNSMQWEMPDRMEPWRWKWHRFIDHLADGKSTEEFFKNLENHT